MCVILLCPPKVRPPRSILDQCAAANPHGGGLAWREGGAVRWLKTDDVGEIERVARRRGGELVIHFRIASVGGVVPALRHPFPVTRRAGLAPSGSAPAVLFQNGTWIGWSEALAQAAAAGLSVPAGEMSDARAAALLVNGLGRDGRRAFFPQTGSSRWVWFGASATEVYGQWHEQAGIRYSNLAWRSTVVCTPCRPSGGHVTRLEAELDWLFERDPAAREFYRRFPRPAPRQMVKDGGFPLR